MAATSEMLAIALRHRPHAACIVPERREERTTEGGLDVAGNREALAPMIRDLSAAGIRVSLFINPDPAQLDAAVAVGAPVVELHTGAYCDAETDAARAHEFERIRIAAAHAEAIGLECHAGHGLSFDTVTPVAAIPTIVELNIGHFLIGEAIFGGLGRHHQAHACVDGPGAGGRPWRTQRLINIMILGIGNDLIDIRRIERTLERYGERFLDRVFTEVERRKSDRRNQRAASYAKRFAAKEACAKALGTGLNRGVYWRDMGVVNLPGGQPTMKLTGGALERLNEITPPGMTAVIHLTLTDDQPLAQAIVLISAVPNAYRTTPTGQPTTGLPGSGSPATQT